MTKKETRTLLRVLGGRARGGVGLPHAHVLIVVVLVVVIGELVVLVKVIHAVVLERLAREVVDRARDDSLLDVLTGGHGRRRGRKVSARWE